MSASSSGTAVAVVALGFDVVDEDADKNKGSLVDYFAKHLVEESSR